MFKSNFNLYIAVLSILLVAGCTNSGLPEGALRAIRSEMVSSYIYFDLSTDEMPGEIAEAKRLVNIDQSVLKWQAQGAKEIWCVTTVDGYRFIVSRRNLQDDSSWRSQSLDTHFYDEQYWNDVGC